MTQSSVDSAQTKTVTSKKYQSSPLRTHLFTVVAAFSGVVLGILASLGFVGSYLHSQMSAEVASLSRQVRVLPAASVSQCGGSGGGGGGVSSASAASPHGPQGPSGGQGGGQSGPKFVHKLVSGVFATNTGSISNTGPDSNNEISFKNSNKTEINNNNNLTYTNNNSQTATSGDAKSSKNTTGGSATSGDATNTNSSSADFTVTN